MDIKREQFNIFVAVNVQDPPKIKANLQPIKRLSHRQNPTLLPDPNELEAELKLVNNNLSLVVNGYLNPR
jgi:hypothetical protein